MRTRRILLAIVAVVVLAVVGFAVWSREPVIAGIVTPPRSAFAPALVENGARLAAIGGCRRCATAAGGADYGGDRAPRPPLGAIPRTNITPSPERGLCRWPRA